MTRRPGGSTIGARMAAVLAVAIVAPSGAVAQAPAADAPRPEPGTPEAEVRIALQLVNPVSTVSALPLTSDFDYDLGPEAGYRYTLDVRRSASRRVSARWRVVSRTLAPVIAQRDVAGMSGGQFGLGDVLQATLLTPAGARTAWWGVGPAVRVPTATDSLLGTGKWSAGPAGALVHQTRAWTVGAVAQQLWSFAGPSGRADVNATDVQPFVWWTSATALTFGGEAEATYDWTTSRWETTLDVGGSQVITVNARSASVGLYARAFPGGDERSPRWGVRFVVTLVFPRPD